MGSSGSTRNRSPDRPFRLLLLLAGEDHPKACTGRRLVRRGRAVPVRATSRLDRPPLLLDPHSPEPLSAGDRAVAASGGILAIDCSWNRLRDRGGLPGEREGRAPTGVPRRLPLLVAANPQHYGRIGELNTVEALSAALYVLGRPKEAAGLLEGFRGGSGFLEINRDRLEQYRRGANAEDVRALERSMFGARP
jgi:pre-rRNA-processing protein TSR3